MRRGADTDETAAIVAAVERFLSETAPQAPRPEAVDPWRRAALLEGVGAKRNDPGHGRWDAMTEGGMR